MARFTKRRRLVRQLSAESRMNALWLSIQILRKSVDSLRVLIDVLRARAVKWRTI